jgi:hypothetical protein
MQDPAEESGVCKSTEWKEGSALMIHLLLIVVLVILRTRRIRFKIEIDL